jgi:formyltetrahydrofolate synthetase
LWPGLTADVVARHYPDSKETPKGHGRKAPSGQRSTKITTLALDDSDDVFGINNIEAPRPIKKERTVFYRVLDMNDEAAQKIYTDQPERFPKKSSRGNQYIMVLTEVDSNAILGEPMKNRTTGEMIIAYQVLIDRLNSAGIFPKLHILDNECSTELKAAIKNNKMTFQLVPPHDHCRNIAEKAIQTFKDSKTILSPSSVVQIKCFLCTFGIDSSVKPSIPSTCYDLHA